MPVDALDGNITLSGETMSNVEIADLIAAFMANPGDPAALDGVRAFKSGARSGTTHARMSAIQPVNRTDHDGVTRIFRQPAGSFRPLDSPDPAADQSPVSTAIRAPCGYTPRPVGFLRWNTPSPMTTAARLHMDRASKTSWHE